MTQRGRRERGRGVQVGGPGLSAAVRGQEGRVDPWTRPLALVGDPGGLCRGRSLGGQVPSSLRIPCTRFLVPQTQGAGGRFQLRTCNLSQLWRSEVQNQGVGGAMLP